MVIHLGCRLLVVPRTPPLNPCSVRDGANVEPAVGCQVRSSMFWGNGGDAINPPIFPALHLSGHPTE